MPVTNFCTVSGEIIGEKTAGSPRVDYLTDALGSITATVNQSAQVVNTYRYKPFGATLAKTGTGPDPAFGWIGTQGYKPTQRKFSDFYVRARHDDSTTGRWTTPDPIGYYGGDLNLFRNVRNMVVSRTDPLGLDPRRGRNQPRLNPMPGYPGPHTLCKDMGPPGVCYACAYNYYRFDLQISDPEMLCKLANSYCHSCIDCGGNNAVPPVGPTAPPQVGAPPQRGGSDGGPWGWPAVGMNGPTGQPWELIRDFTPNRPPSWSVKRLIEPSGPGSFPDPSDPSLFDPGSLIGLSFCYIRCMDFYRNPEACSGMCKRIANMTCDQALDLCLAMPPLEEQKSACFQTVESICTYVGLDL